MKTKALLFPVCLMLASCGEYKEPGAARNLIGESRAATARSVSSTDRANLGTICAALSQKSTTIASVVGTNHTFSTLQTDCDANVVTNADINVVIQNSPSGYVFKRVADGLDFVFPQVETNSVGALADVCGDLSLFTNPQVDQATGAATWITTTGISSADCAPASGEICVQIEQGQLNNNQSYTLHTKEWMRVRVNPTQAKLGFYTLRKRLTQSICSVNKSQITEALLK